jgi:hypothetical protein
VAVSFARLFDADLDVVSESREELHQALGGKRAGTTTHQIRDVRLGNTKDLPGLCLRQLPCLDGAENLQRQIRFQQLLVRVGQTQIGETLPLPSSYSIVRRFLVMSFPPLRVKTFGIRQPLPDQVDFKLRCCNPAL